MIAPLVAKMPSSIRDEIRGPYVPPLCSAKAMDLPEQPGFEVPLEIASTNKDKENDGELDLPHDHRCTDGERLALRVGRVSNGSAQKGAQMSRRCDHHRHVEEGGAAPDGGAVEEGAQPGQGVAPKLPSALRVLSCWRCHLEPELCVHHPQVNPKRGLVEKKHTNAMSEVRAVSATR